MSVIPEVWKRRIVPEGFAAGSAIALAAYGLIPLQRGLNLTLHEQLTSVPSDQLQLIAVGLFLGTTVATGLINAGVIKKYNYCSDIHTTASYVGLGLAKGIALGTAINLVWGTIVNPNEWNALANLIGQNVFGVGESRIFLENLIARATLGFAYLNILNGVIMAGGGSRLANVSNNVRTRIHK